MTFKEFIDSHYLPYVEQRKRSWKIDRSLLSRHLIPAFGLAELHAIEADHLVQFQTQKLHEGYQRSSINRMTVLMKFTINCAMRWKHRVRNVYWAEDFKELPIFEKRERFLTDEEAKRLVEACRHSSAPVAAHLILLLLLTGARKNELLMAKWEYVDLMSNTIRVPISKSNKTRYLYLSPDAVSLIESLRKVSGSIYCFSRQDSSRPITDLQRHWQWVKREAQLTELRLHDLRHSYASFLISSGRSLFEVQKLLGHADAKTTMRYAHLASKQMIEAASVVGSRVGSCAL